MKLFLHGFTGQPESWDEVIAFLPGGIEAHCPTLLGHDPDATITSKSFAAEVDRLADTLRGSSQRNIHVIGYSQGGRLAFGLLVRHPELFVAATLIGASPGLESAVERRARRKADGLLAGQIEDQGLERFVEFWQALPIFASQKHLSPAKLETQRIQRLEHRPKGLSQALRILGLGQMPNYWGALGDLDLPIQLIVGELDEKFHRIAERMSRLLPRASLKIVDSAGHNLLLEAPQSVAEIISSCPES